MKEPCMLFRFLYCICRLTPLPKIVFTFVQKLIAALRRGNAAKRRQRRDRRAQPGLERNDDTP